MVDLTALEASTRRSALAHLPETTVAADGVTLREVAHTGKIVLRGAPEDRGFMAAAGKALGMVLPGETGGVTSVGSVTAIGLAFDEWLVACSEGSERRLMDSLEANLAGTHFHATDITDSRTVIRVEGTRARDLLEKGCALDLHERAFPDGRAASVPVALADTVLHRRDGEGGVLGYDIYVLRSFADYLWTWLADACVEFGADPRRWTAR